MREVTSSHALPENQNQIMKLKVGYIEIEADSKDDIKFLVEQAQALAGARSNQENNNQERNPNQPKRLKTVGIIHRSAEEKARGWSVEETREERRRINAENGFTEEGILGGAVFTGNLDDLTEVPIDD